MANGNFAGGNGTASNPYLIEDAYDLNAVRKKVSNAHYKLIKDIDMTPYSSGAGFNPIPLFEGGTFDGQFHKIRNLTINRPTQDNIGLFSGIRNSTVQNIIFERSEIIGSRYVGGLSGFLSNHSWTISNISIKGNIFANSFEAGGISGTSSSGAGSVNIIKGCSFDGAIGGSSYVGGIIADVSTPNLIMEDCYVRGYLSFSSKDASVGGVLGTLRSNAARVTNCYAAVKISSTATTNFRGIICGRSGENAIVKNTYYDTTLANGIPSGVSGAIAKTTQQMYDSSSYSGWSSAIWYFSSGKYPILKYQIKNFLRYFVRSSAGYIRYPNTITDSQQVWETVSTSLPHLNLIIDKGMDDLSSLNRKSKIIDLVSTLDSETNNGKIYKATIELDSIYELKSIKRE